MVAPQRNQLSDWEAELHRIRQESSALTESLSEAQFNWKPGPERWSVGQCLDHLAIATALMLDRVNHEISRGRQKGILGTPPFRYKMMGGWFVAMMEKPPGKRPMYMPVNFTPGSGMSKATVLTKYLAVLDDFASALEKSHGLALDKLKAGSGAKGGAWLRFNLAAWFAATLAHLRRHLAQARRVTETEGFPAR
jgi:hypothetical protein